MNPLRIPELARIEILPERLLPLLRLCRPRILMVTDASLDFGTGPFGLSRVLQALTTDSGVTNKPALTLAYRGQHPAPNPITVGSDTYTVINSFNFASAATAVTVANYDQIWLFGFSAAALAPGEITALANFMNAGGGVFATGDHGAIGRGLCGSLPRIRHMRDWSNVAMGGEPDIARAVTRIDTVVDPGANGLYDFSDQSDSIPQRIYPNYSVSAAPAPQRWTARIHPLLMLPGAPVVRDGASGNVNFNLDIDVLPDHPHESVCFAVNGGAAFTGSYSHAGTNLNFAEFPALSGGGGRVPATIVAFGVSGGRSVWNNVWKPPVQPRMFGLISAWDGRLAAPYPGQSQRPGRIVCDSTWHHFVNVNLQGMGSNMGGVFTPDANLRKIYAYFRNIQAWLQPANRVLCRLWWDLIVLRLQPRLIEELSLPRELQPLPARIGLGLEALAILREEGGADAAEEFVDALLLGAEDTARIADALQDPKLQETQIDATGLRAAVLGSLLLRVAEAVPEDEPEQLLKLLERGPEGQAREFAEIARESLREALAETAQRAETTLGFVAGLRGK